MRYFLRIFFLLCTASFTALTAQDLVPPVENFSKDMYKAGSQNWDVSIADDAMVYVANNDGLLRYDGIRWELFTLPSKTIIRSVLFKDGRIYTGSYEEFGYWQKNKVGSLEYVSLTHLLEGISYNDEEIWQVISYKNGVAFRSFGKLYVYQDNAIRAYVPGFFITALNTFKDKLIVGSDTGDVFTFENGAFERLFPNRYLNGDTVRDLLEVDDKLYIGTKREGLFYWSKNTLNVWQNEELNKFLKTNEINRMRTFKEKIVFGTIKNGILIYDFKSKDIVYLNRMNGLQNNTVLSMAFKKTFLFIGMDNGIDKVNINSPIRYYKDLTGELGAVYALAVHEGTIYLGSNTGIHFWKNGKRNFVQGSQGQVWSFLIINNSLYASHNGGVYKINKNTLSTISSRTGCYTIFKVPNAVNKYLSATYNGIDFYSVQAGELRVERRANEFTTSVNKIVFQDNNTFWASHPYKGFFKIELDLDSSKVSTVSYYNNLPQLKALKTEIHSIKGEIVFNNSGKWFVYKPIADTLVAQKDLDNYNDHRLIGSWKDTFWFKHKIKGSIVITNFEGDSLFIPNHIINKRSIEGAESVFNLNDSLAYVTLSEGFAQINTKLLFQNNQNLTPPKALLVAFKDSDSLRVLKLDEPIIIQNKEAKKISIQAAAPEVENPSFYYDLRGHSKGIVTNGKLEFQNLKPGKYALDIVTSLDGKKSSDALKVNFIIMPPWYAENIMILIYFIVVVFVVLGVHKLNKNKLEKHKQLLKETLLKEQEKKLQLDERKRLMEEIKIKRKELANTAYQAAERNRTLNEIKNELFQEKNKLVNTYRLKSIESKIDKITKGTNDWKVFETNFNEINDDFFRDLLEQYPQLSTKDLKLCAYLKINLSTKEIAPLMSITVRGVEIHRYRLRKKLGLKYKTNLSKFLISKF